LTLLLPRANPEEAHFSEHLRMNELNVLGNVCLTKKEP